MLQIWGEKNSDIVQSGRRSAPCKLLFKIQLLFSSSYQGCLGQLAACHVQWWHICVQREHSITVDLYSLLWNCMMCMAVWSTPALHILSFCTILCVHGGHPVADCIYLVEPGVFWSFFFFQVLHQWFVWSWCFLLKLTVSMSGLLTCMKMLLPEVVCIVCIFILNVSSAACPAEMGPLGWFCPCVDAFP